MLSITFSSVDEEKESRKKNKKEEWIQKAPQKVLNMELFISQNVYWRKGSLLNAVWRPSDWRQFFARA